MDVVQIRGGNHSGMAYRITGWGFVGIAAHWWAFEIGFEVFKHEDDATGVGLYIGPFALMVGWFKRQNQKG